MVLRVHNHEYKKFKKTNSGINIPKNLEKKTYDHYIFTNFVYENHWLFEVFKIIKSSLILIIFNNFQDIETSG